MTTIRILGLDPGLVHTGWGIIDCSGNKLLHVADGRISPPAKAALSARLAVLDVELAKIIATYQPHCAAVEETFVNRNAASALKLGQARGVVLLAPARAGLEVAEYAANLVKKSVVGAGHAEKEQVQMMVRMLLGRAPDHSAADAADALAVAICHAHHASTHRAMRPKEAV
jgi:crossover junction endodeoxyribonuclease RuvC